MATSGKVWLTLQIHHSPNYNNDYANDFNVDLQVPETMDTAQVKAVLTAMAMRFLSEIGPTFNVDSYSLDMQHRLWRGTIVDRSAGEAGPVAMPDKQRPE